MVLVLKRCSECQADRPTSDFSPHKKGQMGCQGRCRGCRNDSLAVLKRGESRRQHELAEQRELRANGMKRCQACGEVKSIASGFTRNAKRYDGCSSVCRECGSAATSDWQRRNRAHVNRRRQVESTADPAARRAQMRRENLNRKARKRKNFIEAVDPRVVYARDGGLCGLCGETVDGAFDIDHIVPLALDGEHSYANVQLAHPSCNRAKGARLVPRILEVVTDGR